MLMRASGRGSISSFLKLAVDVAWVVARDLFVPENAKRFAAIGIVLAVMEASGMFIATIVSLAFGVFSPGGEGMAFGFPNINWPVWFAVMTLLALAQVFGEGAARREEQKMTI